MTQPQKYVRKPFHIEAIRVTAENMEAVARWSLGSIKTDGPNSYIKVNVHRPLNGRQTKAFVGDWILYAGTGFKVYTDKAFHSSFEQIPILNVEPKFVDGLEHEDPVESGK